MAVRDILNSAAGSSGKTYVDDVFSTYLYTGNGATQTITNGIDLAGKGGLVWCKNRAQSLLEHILVDTARGATKVLYTDSALTQATVASSVTSFSSNGFSIGALTDLNQSSDQIVSWTFRKAPKFFDVVTYTGDDTSNRAISHSLGSIPGMIIVKGVTSALNWAVYHTSLGTTQRLSLNANSAAVSAALCWGSTSPSSTSFYVGQAGGDTNNNGTQYVAYVFANESTADSFIKCGTFTTDVSGAASVTLGWEPQFILFKRTDVGGPNGNDWQMMDSARALTVKGSADGVLFPSSTSAESQWPQINLSSTGFETTNEGYMASSATFIYLAIRRPNKPPTSATQVFSPIASSAATGTALTTSFPVDMQIFSLRTGTTNKGNTYDRLRGVSSTTTESGARLITNSTAVETAAGNGTRLWDNTGFQMPSTFGGASTMFWNFRRAPGFMDVVCDTGTGAAHTISHGLGVVPELVIRKGRSGATQWEVYSAAIANTEKLVLNSTAAKVTDTTAWNSTSPTASVFTVGTGANVNTNTATYVTYLFATLPGISKVGSYTGNGSSQTINCGFSTGARFVLIKRTDSTGDWYVWDTARGIVAANDPHLSLNTAVAEVTTDDSIDPDNSGFIVNQLTATNINITSATYIYLAIA